MFRALSRKHWRQVGGRSFSVAMKPWRRAQTSTASSVVGGEGGGSPGNGNDKPRVLITGGAGQLGTELARVLRSVGNLFHPAPLNLSLSHTHINLNTVVGS